jgi:hypothetical protein
MKSFNQTSHSISQAPILSLDKKTFTTGARQPKMNKITKADWSSFQKYSQVNEWSNLIGWLGNEWVAS